MTPDLTSTTSPLLICLAPRTPRTCSICTIDAQTPDLSLAKMIKARRLDVPGGRVRNDGTALVPVRGNVNPLILMGKSESGTMERWNRIDTLTRAHARTRLSFYRSSVPEGLFMNRSNGLGRNRQRNRASSAVPELNIGWK